MARFISEARDQASRITWPEGKTFAFTVFDDPDYQTIERAGAVYDFLSDHGFRTTKGIWPGGRSSPAREEHGGTCGTPRYLDWVLTLQRRGFEIGWHGAQPVTSTRDETIEGLETYRRLFGDWPAAMAQHFLCEESVYWGEARLSSPPVRAIYSLLTLGRRRQVFHGDTPGHPLYWSDLCRERIRYVRNFVFADINTLKACPPMPYHDPARPDVNHWFGSTDGNRLSTFVRALSERNQDRLEEEGGACIMYAHFAYQFVENGILNQRFRALMERLGKKNGWFVPVTQLLDHIMEQRGGWTLEPAERAALERRWLADKIRYGTT